MVKKKYIVTFLLMLIACAALFLAACGNTEKQESGAEVGTYYNDDSGNEYLISLKEQGNVEFKVDGTDSVGTYQLDGEKFDHHARRARRKDRGGIFRAHHSPDVQRKGIGLFGKNRVYGHV